MELKQKYSGVKKRCRFDEWFIDLLIDLPYDIGIDIMKQIEGKAGDLPIGDWSQMIGGVSHGEKPYFFQIEYLKTKEKGAIFFLDIEEISCDEYLDYINLKQTL